MIPYLYPYKTIIQQLSLLPHPEGGYYCETYRSSGTIPQSALPSSFGGDRAYSTAIYFLLPLGQKSRLHRIASDEIWHFYSGVPLEIIEITPAGTVKKTMLGSDLATNQSLQYMVPAGHWFGSRPVAAQHPQGYSLVGCTVAPGFDFKDFEIADQKELIRLFPAHEKLIVEMT